MPNKNLSESLNYSSIVHFKLQGLVHFNSNEGLYRQLIKGMNFYSMAVLSLPDKDDRRPAIAQDVAFSLQILWCSIICSFLACNYTRGFLFNFYPSSTLLSLLLCLSPPSSILSPTSFHGYPNSLPLQLLYSRLF